MEQQGSVVQAGRSRKAIIGVVGIVILAALLGAWRFLAPTATNPLIQNISGVWKNQASGEIYVIEKKDDDYRMAVSGKRLTIKNVDVDAAHNQLVFTVLTESGLKAVWVFTPNTATPGSATLSLSKDDFVQEEIALQRMLTVADQQRIAQLKPGKKPLWSPGFSCAKAVTDVERMICTDRSLAEQDAALGRFYVANPYADKSPQKSWLADVRNRCADIPCLKEAYTDRLSGLGLTDEDGSASYAADAASYEGDEASYDSSQDGSEEAAAPAADAAAAPAAEAAAAAAEPAASY